MAVEQRAWLSYVPVAAAVIAAISAIASGFSSFYAYRSQSAGERSAIFSAQFDTATAANYDLNAYLLDEMGMLQQVQGMDMLLSKIPEYTNDTATLSPLQKIGILESFKSAVNNWGQGTTILTSDGQTELRDLIKMQLLFPVYLVRPLLAVLNQTHDVALFIKQNSALISDLEKAVSLDDRTKLEASAKELKAKELQAAALQSEIDNMRNELIKPLAEISAYLRLDKLEPKASN
jgi:hypothetical protein